jgi:hypothetical protein
MIATSAYSGVAFESRLILMLRPKSCIRDFWDPEVPSVQELRTVNRLTNHDYTAVVWKTA